MKALDDVFNLLDRQRRRYALYFLADADGPVRVDELAEQIAEWESGEFEGVPDEAYADVTLTLVHQHLPKAAEAEYVEFDREEDLIRLTGTPTEFDVVLSVARAIEQPAKDDVMARLGDLV